MATDPGRNELNPESIMEMNFSFAASRILATGVQMDVFSQVAAGRKTVAEIAKVCGASERGTRMLLDALTGFELLAKPNGTYALTPLSERFLVRGSPDYAGAMMEDDSLWKIWDKLPEAVRTGHPVTPATQEAEAEQFFPILISSLHVMNREPARRAAEALVSGASHPGLQVVDVGCGSGVWSIAVAEADPDAHITMQDFPGVLEHTRAYLKRHGVDGRADFLPGDLSEVDFGKERFDVALLGNIVHSEGENSSRELFRRLHRALRSGGQIAIADMIPNDGRTGPPFPLIFALNMLLHTETGDTYTLADYTRWLTEAGFAEVKTADIGTHSPFIIGTRS